MANTKRRQNRPTGQTYGNVAYKLDYYGDVVAAPKTKIKPQLRAVDTAAVPQSTPTVNHRPHERTRVRVKVRQQQAVAPFAIVGFLMAAVAAVLLSMQYGVINPNAGFLVGLKAFTAAVLGGIGSIPGAMLGGLVLGVAEAFGADIFGDQYKDVVAFGLLVLVLLFRPTGILGRPEVEKV